MANEIARSLRKRQTIAGTRLWDELRQLRRRGYHFSRQAPIDDIIVDFACIAQRLVIEVDGIQHEEPSHRMRDSARDAKLHDVGFNVLRFSNGDVMEHIDGVILEILAALGAMVKQEEMTASGSIPPPLTPPRRGEGNVWSAIAQRNGEWTGEREQGR